MSDTTLRDQLAQIIYDTLNGQYGDFNMPDDAADAILAAGWRPPARTVTTVEELSALTPGTVVIDAHQRAFQRFGDGWEATGLVGGHEVVARPAIVLWEPEEGE